MSPKLADVTLDTLAGGAALEQWQEEWQKLLANILDSKTDPEAKRSLTLTVTVEPTKDRESAIVGFELKPKLAGPKPLGTSIFIGMRDGKPAAVTRDPRQSEMFDSDRDESITPLNRDRAVR